MPPPEKKRIVREPPLYKGFRTVRDFGTNNIPVYLTLDEFEAIRLADYLELEHEQASQEMEVSRSTFSRLVKRARKKVTLLLIEGKPLYIEGGNVHFRDNLIRCNNCGNIFHANFDEKNTICPSCGSQNISDLAIGFGHGRCCRGFNRHQRGRR